MRERPREKDLGREGEKCNGERKCMGKWRGLILTVGLNQKQLRMFAEGVNQIQQYISWNLWLGMFSASNGAKSFARITLDFTLLSRKLCLKVTK